MADSDNLEGGAAVVAPELPAVPEAAATAGAAEEPTVCDAGDGVLAPPATAEACAVGGAAAEGSGDTRLSTAIGFPSVAPVAAGVAAVAGVVAAAAGATGSAFLAGNALTAVP